MTTATTTRHSTPSEIKNTLYRAAFVGHAYSSLAFSVRNVLKDRVLPYFYVGDVTLRGDPVDVTPWAPSALATSWVHFRTGIVPLVHSPGLLTFTACRLGTLLKFLKGESRRAYPFFQYKLGIVSSHGRGSDCSKPPWNCGGARTPLRSTRYRSLNQTSKSCLTYPPRKG